jgi:hypothetical protein
MTLNNTPSGLIVADFVLFILMNLEYVYLIRLYIRNRNPFTLFLILCGTIINLCQLLTIFGLAFGFGDSQQIIKLLSALFALGSPGYMVVIFQRCTTFDLMFPKWFMQRWKMLMALSILFSFIALWPLYVYALNQPLEVTYPFIYKWHFVGWSLWMTFFVFLDLFLCVYSFKFVIEITRGVNEDNNNGPKRYLWWDTRQELLMAGSPLILLLLILMIDIGDLALIYSLCSQMVHPNVIQMNILTELFLGHCILGFAYILSLAKLIVAQNKTFRETTNPMKSQQQIRNPKKKNLIDYPSNGAELSESLVPDSEVQP